MDASRKHIRGSSLLLAGRLLAVGINFFGQVLLVRYLSTTDYGLWAYALSVVSVAGLFATLAFDKGIDRFLPIYHEQKQYGRLFGTLIFVSASIFLVGILVAVVFHLFSSPLATMINQPGAWALLFILVFVIPLEGLDHLLIAVFASFARPRAIFFRKHLMGPGLKLAVVLLLIALGADVTFMAYGYVAASLLNVVICGALVVRLLQAEGVLNRSLLSTIEFPVRELVVFTAPLILSEIVGSLLATAGPLFIGYFHGPEQVALFRAVVPVAALTMVVRHSFSPLFTPQASRLFSKGDLDGIRDLYVSSTIWMTVLSFPVFAMMFGASQHVILLLYGQRYADSGPILAILALGWYAQVSIGLTHLTLKALGKIGSIVMTDAATLVTFLVLNIALIPSYGALGAAMGTAGALVAYAVYRNIALFRATGQPVFPREMAGFYSVLLTCIAALALIHLFVSSIYLAIPLVCIISLTFFALTRRHLDIDHNFPELQTKLRMLSLLVARKAG